MGIFRTKEVEAQTKSRDVHQKLTDTIEGIKNAKQELAEAIAAGSTDTSKLSQKIAQLEIEKEACQKAITLVALERKKATEARMVEQADELEEMVLELYHKMLPDIEEGIKKRIQYYVEKTKVSARGGTIPPDPLGKAAHQYAGMTDPQSIANAIVYGFDRKGKLVIAR